MLRKILKCGITEYFICSVCIYLAILKVMDITLYNVYTKCFFFNLGVLLTHFSMTTKICFYFFLNIDFQTSVDNIQ